MSKLWYNNPAKAWKEALPLGSGMLGGMVFGQPFKEMVQLNEDSIWSGKPLDRHNPDAYDNLDKVRKLVREGKIVDAEKTALYALSGVPHSQSSYQTAGEWYLNFDEKGEVSEYHRELDLEEGIVKVQYKCGDTLYKREYLTSYPDGVMAIHITAKGPNKLSFTNRLERCINCMDEVIAEDGDSVRMMWRPDPEEIAFCSKIKVGDCDGKVETIGEHLIITEATKATVYLSICTSFRYQDYQAACNEKLAKAIKKGYGLVRADHVADYQSLYKRVKLQFDNEDKLFSKMPTDERLKAVGDDSEDIGLIKLYFDYGRYLMIASSRQGSLPGTLQGIWNDKMMPMWNCKYTINANLEMNYWLAESGNLSECHLPFFDLLERAKENGKKTARVMYNCSGSMAHHNLDIYADTAPQDHYIPASYWVLGEAWMATHIWEHYQFTQDREFLEEHFDVYEQCAQFLYDFMVEGPDGTLLVCPSVSPENTYIMDDGSTGRMCEGATMDSEIITEMFKGYIEACKVLGKESEKIKKAENLLERLPKFKIGKHGQLQEWMQDYDEAEPDHRHISHLYALYPGTFFEIADNLELNRAAKVTLERRLAHGGGYTGWSRAWIIAYWARLRDGEKAYQNFYKLFQEATYPNLFDNHPLSEDMCQGPDIFQIDGNLGAPAAVIEMLFQSHGGYYRTLPAVPKMMSSGQVEGIKARGGATIAMKWQDKKVTELKILPLIDEEKLLIVNGQEQHLELMAGKEKILRF